MRTFILPVGCARGYTNGTCAHTHTDRHKCVQLDKLCGIQYKNQNEQWAYIKENSNKTFQPRNDQVHWCIGAVCVTMHNVLVGRGLWCKQRNRSEFKRKVSIINILYENISKKRREKQNLDSSTKFDRHIAVKCKSDSNRDETGHNENAERTNE